MMFGGLTVNSVWHEVNGQIWLKLILDQQHKCEFVNLAYVQSINPYTRTITMSSGFTYNVSEETINGIVDKMR